MLGSCHLFQNICGSVSEIRISTESTSFWLRGLCNCYTSQGEELARRFQETNISPCDAFLPRSKLRVGGVAWWSPLLTRLRRRQNEARKKAQRCCPCRAKVVYTEVLRRARSEYKHQIKTAKKASWESFVRDISNENVYGLPYKLAADEVRAKEVLTTLQSRGVHTTDMRDTLALLLQELVPLGYSGWCLSIAVFFYHPLAHDDCCLKKKAR